MQNKIINLLLVVVVLLAGFYFYKNNIQNKQNTQPTTNTTTPASNNNTVAQLTTIPPNEGRYLMENCTYIDVTFNNLPFSMSIDNQAGIRSNLQLIDATAPPPVLKTTCQPLGTIYYDVNAETVLAADIMFGEGCNYFVFKKDGQAVYANRMTADAVDYFTNIITQVKVK